MARQALALVAVALTSSAATVAFVELLRPADRGAEVPAARGEVARAVEVPDPAPETARLLPAYPSTAEQDERFRLLEERLAALEAAARDPRRPVPERGTPGPAVPPEAADDLRALVLGWVEEDRDARRRLREQEEQANERTELEFEARYRAFDLAQRLELTDWERDRLYEVVLAVETRRREVEESIDMRMDPAEVEAQFVAFDEWAEEYERAELGDLYDRIEASEEEEWEDEDGEEEEGWEGEEG